MKTITDFSFKISKRVGNARLGQLQTPHGMVKTPVFMPVGTVGSVKALSTEEVAETGAQIILGNTYHLFLRPGEKVVRKLGGIHEFMRWHGPILTDSGGYQVSSLGLFGKKSGEKLAKIDEDGVTFQSFLDGTTHRLTPEKAMQIQTDLGADIMMAFDEATPDQGKSYARSAMRRTHNWLVRSKIKWMELEDKKHFQETLGSGGKRLPQALFGIIQGGNYRDLRRESAKFVIDQELPGIALGGGTIGQDSAQTEENIGWVRDLVPKQTPVYAMGVGVSPTDVIEVIKSGADMFDCVAPTKLARTGYLYHGILTGGAGKWRFESEYRKERLDIRKREFKLDRRVIDENCDCLTCTRGYSRAYLHHLFRSKELLFYRLASIHNLRVMNRITQMIRESLARQ